MPQATLFSFPFIIPHLHRQGISFSRIRGPPFRRSTCDLDKRASSLVFLLHGGCCCGHFFLRWHVDYHQIQYVLYFVLAVRHYLPTVSPPPPFQLHACEAKRDEDTNLFQELFRSTHRSGDQPHSLTTAASSSASGSIIPAVWISVLGSIGALGICCVPFRARRYSADSLTNHRSHSSDQSA